MDRVLDDNGVFQTTVKPPTESPLVRENAILLAKLKNTEIALRNKKDELSVMRANINESNPLKKQEVLNKDKEIAQLKESISVLVEKEKALVKAQYKIKGLEKEVNAFKEELIVKSKAKK